MQKQQQTSKAGIDLIVGFESFVPVVYVCPAGKPTIGYGHVVLPEEKFATPITREFAREFLSRDLAVAEAAINGLKLGLAQHQFDALVSFVFNVGVGNFRASTLCRKLLQGDLAGVAREFPRWDKAHGRALKGLVRRRTAERAMFAGEAHT